jgi:hypothetical protein
MRSPLHCLVDRGTLSSPALGNATHDSSLKRSSLVDCLVRRSTRVKSPHYRSADTTAQEQRKRLVSVSRTRSPHGYNGGKAGGVLSPGGPTALPCRTGLNPMSQAAFDAAREATAALEAQRGAPPQVKALTHTFAPTKLLASSQISITATALSVRSSRRLMG